jgi:hypothetical protein
MGEADLYIPLAIKPTDGSVINFDRPGLVSSRTIVGPTVSRDYGDGIVAGFELVFPGFRADTYKLHELTQFIQKASGPIVPFWFQLPVTGVYSDRRCYPRADGSRTIFAHPLAGYVSDPFVPVVKVGETIQTSGYTLHSASNQILEDWAPQAAADGSEDLTTYFTGENATISYAPFGYRSPYCYKVTPTTGAASGFYPATPMVPISNGVAFRAHCWFMGRAETAFTVRAKIYNSSKAFQSNQDGSAVAATFGDWTYAYVEYTPAADGYVAIEPRYTGTQTDVWFVDCIGVTIDGNDMWHHPAANPGLVEFSSAPADLSWVNVSGIGNFTTRARLYSPAIAAMLYDIGNTDQFVIQAYEELF